LDDEFLHSLWKTALRRPLDEEGRREFLYRLHRGASRLTVIEELLASPEYVLAAHDNRQFAHDLYRIVLGREADAGGVDAWSAYAGQNGRRAAFDSFCSTEEARVKYCREDSYDVAQGGAGVILVTFRRYEALLTFGSVRSASPLSVTKENWKAVEKVLHLALFDVLATRIDRHLARPLPPPW